MPTYEGYHQPFNAAGAIDNLRNSLVGIYAQNNELKLRRDLGNRQLDISQQQVDQQGDFQAGTLSNQAAQTRNTHEFNQGTLQNQSRQLDIEEKRSNFLNTLAREAHDAELTLQNLRAEDLELDNQGKYARLVQQVRAQNNAQEMLIAENVEEVINQQFNGNTAAMAQDPRGRKIIEQAMSDIASLPGMQAIRDRTNTENIEVITDNDGLYHIGGKDRDTGEFKKVNPGSAGQTAEQVLQTILTRSGPDQTLSNLANLNFQEAQRELALGLTSGEFVMGALPENLKRRLAAPVQGAVTEDALKLAQNEASQRRGNQPKQTAISDDKLKRSIDIAHERFIPNNSNAGTAGGFFDDDFEIFAGKDDSDAQGRKKAMAAYAQSVINTRPKVIAKLLNFPSDDASKWTNPQVDQAVALIIESQRKTTRSSGKISNILNDLGSDEALPMPTQRQFLEAVERLHGIEE